MCPSFRATGEEEHSTRGRARLLFEMLRGRDDRGRLEERRGSAGARPVPRLQGLQDGVPGRRGHGDLQGGVPLALLRGPAAAPLGRACSGGSTAGRASRRWPPGAANFFTQTRGLSAVARAALGIDPRRSIPTFAARDLPVLVPAAGAPAASRAARSSSSRTRSPTSSSRRSGRAAVEVLEAAGFRVEIPAEDVCCGRPLYDFGMLGEAQHLLSGVLGALERPLRDGLPVVVLEPSCAAVFRDEASNLFPDDEDVRRLARQTTPPGRTSSRGKAPDYRPRGLSGRVLVQTHCHQQALFGIGDDAALLERLGIEARFVEAGCCGMAGAFGLQPGEPYEVSRTLRGTRAPPRDSPRRAGHARSSPTASPAASRCVSSPAGAPGISRRRFGREADAGPGHPRGCPFGKPEPGATLEPAPIS